MASPVEIFFCYAREEQQLLQELKAHLMPLQRQGLIALWADADINAGSEWEVVSFRRPFTNCDDSGDKPPGQKASRGLVSGPYVFSHGNVPLHHRKWRRARNS